MADIGFFGNSRRRNNRAVPHFQVVLGGKWKENAGSYGLAMGAVPSKVVPDVLSMITNRYVDERDGEENFQDWVTRLGKREVKAMLTPYMKVPKYEENPVPYSDWGDPREFTIGDIGVGEADGWHKLAIQCIKDGTCAFTDEVVNIFRFLFVNECAGDFTNGVV